ncbi:hypothetical protein [Microlunatus sp. GCM10028923]|uniref:hypothetical protein n=1 Tax=Microlunatus sp. GCM10028923 TaxID=3273400 RepID=UPI00361CFB6F
MRSRCLIVAALALLLAVGPVPALAEPVAGPSNWARGATATTGLGDGPRTAQSMITDGDRTSGWTAAPTQGSSAARGYGTGTKIERPLVELDLGAVRPLDGAAVRLAEAGGLTGFELSLSTDRKSWLPAGRATAEPNQDRVALALRGLPVRYLRFALIMEPGASATITELEATSAAAGELAAIAFTDAEGGRLADNAESTLGLGGTEPLRLAGYDGDGAAVSLDGAEIAYASSDSAVASVGADGTVRADRPGASMITATATLPDGRSLSSPYRWIVVTDPAADDDPGLIARTTLDHPRIDLRPGQPAITSPGDVYPTATVRANVDLTASGAVYRDGRKVLSVAPVSITAGQSAELTPAGRTDAPGDYRFQLTLIPADDQLAPVRDAFSFTALNLDDVPAGASRAAYLGRDGRMHYIADAKGNRIPDFSTVGYHGGDADLPTVPGRVRVPLTDGDATAAIQAAIDEVAARKPDRNGHRGAVELAAGEFRVAGTLKITTGGVVLRGQGSGDDGTVLRGTGAVRRNLVEVRGSAGPQLQQDRAVEITDLTVPVGAASFQVADPAGLDVGDTIMVRRRGNARWIGTIGMDRIYQRPGAGGTKQWTPFDLDSDRVITAVDGNVITVDAPLTNAIERRWGGGSVIPYTDPGRISEVGVEGILAISDFDPSVIDTKMDNEETDPYYADEDHAERFVVFDNVKNAWARDISARHLVYSLVLLGRGAKWVTVRDGTASEFVSVITGGRRYGYDVQGQLTLVENARLESARHGYAVTSRVPGPNVWTGGGTSNDFNTSEPHHRWSTGGLFDDVDARISIMDRAWLGSGRGWAGANYVAWNTRGSLTLQAPPTAQNYSIGHRGTIGSGLVPSLYDPRPRSRGYWDAVGPPKPIQPQSLYRQQLADRG